MILWDYSNTSGNVTMAFQVHMSYGGELADWIQKIVDGLKNEMQDGLFGNYMVDVDSLAVIGMLCILLMHSCFMKCYACQYIRMFEKKDLHVSS